MQWGHCHCWVFLTDMLMAAVTPASPALSECALGTWLVLMTAPHTCYHSPMDPERNAEDSTACHPGQGALDTRVAFCCINIPEIQDLTSDDTRLGGLSFWQVIQKELAVANHCICPLPSLLHSCGLWDLQTNSDYVSLGHREGQHRECQTLSIPTVWVHPLGDCPGPQGLLPHQTFFQTGR